MYPGVDTANLDVGIVSVPHRSTAGNTPLSPHRLDQELRCRGISRAGDTQSEDRER